MFNPTGRQIRTDSRGSGHYGSSRGAGKMHKGTDFICEPGQEVRAPISGHIVRIAKPYGRNSQGSLEHALPEYSGVLIQNETMAVKMFYFEPLAVLIGKRVKAGNIIGTAQDISEKYGPGMKPHIHVQVDSIDPVALLKINEIIGG